MNRVDDIDENGETLPTVESDIILPGKQVDDENSEKIDSGMDEEMAEPSPDAGELNSDSEDEPIVSKKKTKKPMVLDDDDDGTNDINNEEEEQSRKHKSDEETENIDDNATSDSVKASKKKTVSEVLNAIMDSDSDSDAGQSQDSVVKSHKEDNSSGSESDSLTEKIRKKKAKKKALKSDDEDSAPRSSQQMSGLFNSDLFDAEESDSDNDAPAADRTSDRERESSEENDNADDEGFGDDELDPKLKAKLLKMKGAAKKPRKGSDRKAKRDALIDIHSESQRLIRESQVVLPYHQPTPKPLNDFLARATKKQQDYKALRAVREFKKPSVIQHIIANCSPAVTPSSQPKKSSPCNKDSSLLVDNDTPANNPQGETTLKEDLLSKKMEFEEDELPDLDDNVNSAIKSDNATDATQVDSANITDKVENISRVEPEHKTECISLDEGMEVDTETPAQEDSDAIEGENINKKCVDKERLETKENKLNDREDDFQTDNPVVSPETLENGQQTQNELEGKDANESEVTSECPSSASKTPRIQALSGLTDVMPQLSGGPQSFIDFDEEECETPLPSGRDKLMDRFIQHSKKKQHKHAKDVDISIVEKESGPGNSAELKLTSITYHVTEEDENQLQKLDKPGAKLLALKEQLQTKMKVKREEARQKRQELYALENEEGFEEEENEEEKILDDDAEMSEKSDTDIDDDQFDAEFGEEEFEEEDDKEVNPFGDVEAEEDDDDFDPGDALNKESDDDFEDSEEEGATMKLELDTSDDNDESDFENPSQNVRSSSKKKKKHVRKLAISDDEESNLPPAQAPTEEIKPASFKIPKETVSPKESLEDEDDFMSPLSKHLAPTQTQKPKKSGLTLPIEDSQDLYGNTAEPYGSMTFPAGDTQPSQSLNFIMEDSQSQMLDADGFFKVKSITKKPSRASLGLNDISDTQDNMNELMGLCSGRFVDQSQDDGKKASCKQLFSDTGDSGINSTQGQVSDELLGLCSGFFPNDNTQKQKSQGLKRKLEDDEESNASFALLSDNENHMDSDKDELDGDKDVKQNEDFDEVDGEVSRDSTAQAKKKFRGFRGKITGKMRREFVDEEAELSGSEMGSDEDLDLAEEDDIMEMELGDQDVNLTEEELRNQVGRAHLKETIDSDKREILRLQEMYLPDGDLYTDGGGRTRRFRWKNMDDESQQDMFDEGSEEEGPEEDADELRWRMERFEREKFLQEEREKEEKETGSSQFFNLGKKFALKIKDPVTKTTERDFKKPQKTDRKENLSPVKPMLRTASGRKGSFLTRSKEALAKIAERTKSSVNPNATRNSRNFVFQHVSPEKSDAAPKPKPVSKPAASKKPASMQPPAKRQKTKTEESNPGSSIFNILER